MAMTDLICPVFNGIEDSVEMFMSLKRCTKDFRLIVVDNGSTDGSAEFFENSGATVIRLEENKGFGAGINAGLELLDAPNVVFINNDVIVTPGWLENLLRLKEQILSPVGMIGPVSGFVGGRQSVKVQPGLDIISQARAIAIENQARPLEEASFLSFFCCLLDSEMVRSLGPLQEYFPGGYEDNSYCVRCWDAGWKLFIAKQIYISHKGSRTLAREFGNAARVFDARMKYFRKHYDEQPEPKIVALYRVKNDHQNFIKSLEKTSQLVDGIFVWDDNSSPSMKKIVAKFPKVKKYYESHLPFDEYRDRSMLLNWAKGSGRAEGTDRYTWALALDADEYLESKVTYKNLHTLCKVPDPIIRSFILHENTYWFKDFCRIDGIWKGQMHDRLYKLNMNLELVKGTGKGFHCGTIPIMPLDSRRLTTIRIEHFGYDTPKKRQRKYDFYTEMDDEKNKILIGGADYSHLLDDGGVQICKFIPDNHLALNIMLREGEEKEAAQIINEMWGIPQEINLLIEGENEDSRDLTDIFRTNTYLDTENLNLPDKRNFLLGKTHEKWALFIDSDEKLESPVQLRAMMDAYPSAYLFYVKNFQKNRQITVSENVRMFRVAEGLFFSNPIHETVEDSLKPEMKVVTAPVQILHFGYLKSDEFLKEKLEKYYALLLSELEKNPEDARIHFSLALHHFNEDQEPEGIAYLEQAVLLNPDFAEAKKELASMKISQGYRLMKDVLTKISPSHPLYKKLQEMVTALDGIVEQRLKVGKPIQLKPQTEKPIQLEPKAEKKETEKLDTETERPIKLEPITEKETT